MPWTPVMAQGLGLMDGNRRDDETAIAPYRPGDPADLPAMPGQKEREQPQAELSGVKKAARRHGASPDLPEWPLTVAREDPPPGQMGLPPQGGRRAWQEHL